MPSLSDIVRFALLFFKLQTIGIADEVSIFTLMHAGQNHLKIVFQ